MLIIMPERLLAPSRVPKKLVQSALDAVGIDVRLNGDRPWDMKINDPLRFYPNLLRGTLGVGESYMKGQWDSDDLCTWAAHAISADKRPLLQQAIKKLDIPRTIQAVKRRF